MRDFDRPLNKRGKRDAPFMGKLIKEKGIEPDLIITSPARRALRTAEYFAEELSYPKEKIIRDDNLYEAGVNDIVNVISGINSDSETIMLFGHNPGITDFCNSISDKYIDNIPTSAVVSLVLKTGQWSDINTNTCKLEFFEYPKKYLNKDI